MVMFVDGLISVISLIFLIVLKQQFSTNNSNIENQNDYKTNLSYIVLAGIHTLSLNLLTGLMFAFAILSISAAMN
jgi:hypothetical protein